MVSCSFPHVCSPELLVASSCGNVLPVVMLVVPQDELGYGSSVFIVQVAFPEVVLGVAVLSVAR